MFKFEKHLFTSGLLTHFALPSPKPNPESLPSGAAQNQKEAPPSRLTAAELQKAQKILRKISEAKKTESDPKVKEAYDDYQEKVKQYEQLHFRTQGIMEQKQELVSFLRDVLSVEGSPEQGLALANQNLRQRDEIQREQAEKNEIVTNADKLKEFRKWLPKFIARAHEEYLGINNQLKNLRRDSNEYKKLEALKSAIFLPMYDLKVMIDNETHYAATLANSETWSEEDRANTKKRVERATPELWVAAYQKINNLYKTFGKPVMLFPMAINESAQNSPMMEEPKKQSPTEAPPANEKTKPTDADDGLTADQAFQQLSALSTSEVPTNPQPNPRVAESNRAPLDTRIEPAPVEKIVPNEKDTEKPQTTATPPPKENSKTAPNTEKKDSNEDALAELASQANRNLAPDDQTPMEPTPASSTTSEFNAPIPEKESGGALSGVLVNNNGAGRVNVPKERSPRAPTRPTLERFSTPGPQANSTHESIDGPKPKEKAENKENDSFNTYGDFIQSILNRGFPQEDIVKNLKKAGANFIKMMLVRLDQGEDLNEFPIKLPVSFHIREGSQTTDIIKTTITLPKGGIKTLDISKTMDNQTINQLALNIFQIPKSKYEIERPA